MTAHHPTEDEIPVVAAVIERDGRLLVCERPPHKRHGGLWEFPGGKIEDGETYFDAARRELAEELGVEVKSTGEILMSVRDPGSVFVIQFAPVKIQGDPVALEHSQLAWVEREELLDLTLAPSDRRFAEKLLQGV